MTRKIELLAPAKDASAAMAAIECGADAVYIGAEKFGARQAAANTIADIEKITDFAHQYYAKVYVTLNTLLYDDELATAEKMIAELYKIGIDGLIIQDAGLLELDLPPLPLIASTQMDCSTLEKIKFLQDVGFSRATLARELTLEEIRRIRGGTSIELECFIHGALCVGASGKCYMSYAAGGRSGNRGQCAQPCRKSYSLTDAGGSLIIKDRHLLSLKDMNRCDYLEQLIDAGVNAFKIEGRLKDIDYVANTVGFYRKKFDQIIAKKGLARSSSGSVKLDFEPDPAKTFNRGFTNYGIGGQPENLGSINTPKSIGQFIGTVKEVRGAFFVIDGREELHNGDGICFFDYHHKLCGTAINRVEGRQVFPQKMHDICTGYKIYRNYDHKFCQKLAGKAAERKISLKISVNGLIINAADEDGNAASVKIDTEPQQAEKKDAAKQTFRNQLTRLGNTIFECSDFRFETEDVYFVPASKLNDARRKLIEQLTRQRQINRPAAATKILKNTVPSPQKHLDFTGNVLNEKAREFYSRHGVETIASAAESGLDLTGKLVMTTKYCLRRELDLCPRPESNAPAEPLFLADDDGNEYEIKFRCGQCGMEIFLCHKEKNSTIE